MHRIARIFELSVAAFGIAVLLFFAVATHVSPLSFAQTAAAANSACVAPSFYSLTVTAASLNTPWNLPLLSTIDGPYAPTVTATGLAPGITLQDQKTTLSAGGSVLHNWLLVGAPTMLGTYAMTVVAQNSCGGASTLITLPINNVQTAQGTALCPAGTSGTYPNCAASSAATVTFDTASLTATTPNPTITGTSNSTMVNLSARSSTGVLTTSGNVPVSGGRWSASLTNLVRGVYSLFLYDGSGMLLIPGSLVVSLPGDASANVTPSPVPTAHVNVQAGVVIPNTTVALNTSSCVAVNNTLQYGSRGSDVVQLQNYLINKGLLQSGSATGYFGPATRAAVQQFQAGEGIVSSGNEATTGYGVVGTRTRAVIGCQSTLPGTATQQPVPRISCPAYPSPVCTNGSLYSLGHDVNGCSLGYQCVASAQNRYISPYDSNYTPPTCPAVSAPACSNGTLMSLGTDYSGCSFGSYCQQNVTTSCPSGTTGTYPNCVSSTGASLSASPTSGAAPLGVTFTGTALTGSYTVDFGDNSTPVMIGCGGGCNIPTSVSRTHIYTTAGTYTATLTSNGTATYPYSSSVTTTVTVTEGNICVPPPQVLCAPGYHGVGGGTDTHGCQLGTQCVADTTTTDATTQSVIALYSSELGRTVTATDSGVVYWVAQVKSGAITLAGVKKNFDDTAAITALYQSELGRAPDAAGLAYWLQQLESGAVTLAGIKQNFDAIANPPVSTSAISVSSKGSSTELWVVAGFTSNDCSTSGFTIQWGDGHSIATGPTSSQCVNGVTVGNNNTPAGSPINYQSSYSYATRGTYTITLLKNGATLSQTNVTF